MFIRRAIGGSKEKPIRYLQLVESYRDELGRPKHRVLCTLGREEEIINSGIVESLSKKFAAFSKNLMVIDKTKEFLGQDYILGQILVIEGIWKKLRLDETLKRVEKRYGIKYSLNRAVKLMVLNRLIDPKSKLSIDRWKRRLYGDQYEDIGLWHLYRALDLLADNKDMLEKEMVSKTRTLFKPVINLVFYDLTTVYFESQKESVLKRFGYSKDNKTDCVQIVIGVIVNEDNIPLGYEVFSGNTFEGKTVGRIIKKLREDFQIEKVVFVADKGVLSREVLKEIEATGSEYIIAAKIKQLPRQYHRQIQDRAGYRQINEDLWVSEIEVGGRRIVLGYSEDRADRDRAMRKALIERLKEKIKEGQGSRLIQSHYKRYLEVKELEVRIDDSKIEEDSKWDGYFGYITNNKEFSGEEVIGAYKLLWQVEETFRCMKSSLDLRPIYHWTEKRIEGHIMLCFLSFYILRVIQRRLREGGIDTSIERVMEELDRIKAVEIKTEKETIYARTAIERQNAKIFKALGIKIPSFILKESPVVQ